MIVWIVSAWNRDGTDVAEASVCSAMEPGKWPPAMMAVTPGSRVVCVWVRNWAFADVEGRASHCLSADAR